MHDFPDLEKEKQMQIRQQAKVKKSNKPGAMISITNSWDKSRVNQNPFMDNELNKQSHTRKLIEEFPTLSNYAVTIA